jgi:hypothetical protein
MWRHESDRFQSDCCHMESFSLVFLQMDAEDDQLVSFAPVYMTRRILARVHIPALQRRTGQSEGDLTRLRGVVKAWGLRCSPAVAYSELPPAARVVSYRSPTPGSPTPAQPGSPWPHPSATVTTSPAASRRAPACSAARPARCTHQRAASLPCTPEAGHAPGASGAPQAGELNSALGTGHVPRHELNSCRMESFRSTPHGESPTHGASAGRDPPPVTPSDPFVQLKRRGRFPPA